MADLLRFMTAAVLLAAAPSVFAADKLNEEQSKYFGSAAHTERLKAAFDESAALAFQGCKDVSDKGLSVTFVQPVTFNKAGVPTGGSWKEQHAVTGCGATKALNFFAAPGLDSTIAFTAGMIGTTLTDIDLQRTAVQYAFLAVTQKGGACRDFESIDTRLDQPPAAEGKVWYEMWTIRGCGHTYDVPMLFTPQGANTSITADIRGVAERKP